MHYFITSRIDRLTSAIELAAIRRLKLFKELNIPAKIVTLNYSRYQFQVWKDLKINADVINPINYFQKLDSTSFTTEEALKKIFNNKRLSIENNNGFIDKKLRIQVVKYQHNLDYVTYLDRWGFADRRDFYVKNQLSYSEYFDDGGKLITRTYYNFKEQAFLTYHYRGGAGNTPVLTLIQLNHLGCWHQFDNESEFWAYFLDCLATKDPSAILYSDREDYVLHPFKLMATPVKKYVILHSAFTKNSQASGDPFPYVKELFDLGEKISGIICATQQEALDLQSRPEVKIPCYAIPVSYLPDELLKRKIALKKRIPGQLIAIARLTEVKRLDHLINVVISLHSKLPFVDLKIYGYADAWQNYETSTRLHRLVKNANATDYIHFCGYQADLTEVYQTADIEVLTSNYEGFSMAILEALGNGCPVVSYNINYGPKELIRNNQNGNLIPAGDSWTLQRTLLYLLTHRSVLKTYSQNAAASMMPYSERSISQSWANFISQI